MLTLRKLQFQARPRNKSRKRCKTRQTPVTSPNSSWIDKLGKPDRPPCLEFWKGESDKGALFFFLIKKEPTLYWEVVDFERDTSSDTEDPGEEEHNVENFMLCSFAHFACSPILGDV